MGKWKTHSYTPQTKEKLPIMIGLTTNQAFSLLQYINVIVNLFIMEIILMNCAEKYQSQQSSSIIHQVTIAFRFRKSLAQEKFMSNLEFRYQIKASSITFRKGFAEFMIPIALFKKFLS